VIISVEEFSHSLDPYLTSLDISFSTSFRVSERRNAVIVEYFPELTKFFIGAG
jgi:hypothetical protein